MFKVIKALNNNAVIAKDVKSDNELIILEKGIGFGKKKDDLITPKDSMRIYTILKKQSEDVYNNIEPVYLEIASEILVTARQTFGDKVDGKVLIPLADHISFAIERMTQNMKISNPIANDIQLLFPEEYKIATQGKWIIKEKTGFLIPEDEVGYITLHVHSSLSDDLVSTSMQMAILVQNTIEIIEKELHTKIDKYSIAYARLLNHIKYMLLRLKTNEQIEIDMQEYVAFRFPRAYLVAKKACKYMAKQLKQEMPAVEISYLAIHIERIITSKKRTKTE